MEAISGKIAIITGGATGIGAAYVKRLFKSGMKGCTIADLDDQGEALAKEMNCTYGRGKAIFVKANVTDKEDFECVFEANMDKFHNLDFLINNAGMFRDRTWGNMIDLNIKSTVYGSLLGIKYMGKHNGSCGGTIVNTASIVGLKGFPAFPCYTGTKHFVVGFTRSIGTEFWYNMTGIRFLTICPGVTITPMITEAKEWVLDGFSGLEEVAVLGIKRDPPQTVEDLAEGLNTILNEGTNGSIWVCKEAKPVFEVVIPPIHAMKKDKCEVKTC